MDFPKPFALSGVVALAALAAISPVAARVFTFKATGGQVDAELVSAEPGNVRLAENGKEFDTTLAELSVPDQEFVRAWMRENRGIFDWPQLRGLGGDGVSGEPIGAGPPRVRWRASVGAGDAAVVVGDRYACTIGARGGQVVAAAFAVDDGRELWQNSYPLEQADARLTATPAIDLNENRLITLGPGGRIDCWNLSDGANIWATLLPVSYAGAEFSADGGFGSPGVFAGRVLVEVGGPTCSLVGLSVINGLEAWRIGKHRSLGVAPAIAKIGKRDVVVTRNEHGLVGRDAEAGTMIWDRPWAQAGTASALPIEGDRVFVTSPDACALFAIDGRTVRPLWENRELCSPLVTPVYHAGYLYGFHGDSLSCLEATSGKVAWRQDGLGAGNLIRCADKLLIQTGNSGELVIADADPAGYKERSRTKVFDGNSRTLPVLASGRIYCRSAAGEVTCLDVRDQPKP